eukprot:Opistho-2@53742
MASKRDAATLGGGDGPASAVSPAMDRKKRRTTSECAELADWSPSSWKSKPIKQQPTYKDQKQLRASLETLKSLPPLVSTGEIDDLRSQLAEVAEGKRFLLQGGDCAELFSYCSKKPIENKLKILLQMSLVLTWGARTPIVRVARMAGQYGKPRTKDTEMVDGEEVLSYRGDNVNGFDKHDREHDPNRLVQAYFHSSATLNYVRALLAGGFADLQHPENWNLTKVRCHATRRVYEDMVNSMLDSLHFMKTIKASEDRRLQSVDLYTSHEGLILDYEESLTQRVQDRWYNVGAHFLWIGDRTRQLDHAHVEYFRGLQNPIGVKVGPSTDPNELVELIRRLDPLRLPGKITIITRYGAAKVDDCLPKHIKAVTDAGLKVVWCCDPMHGNTENTSNRMKTRNFDKILEELRRTFAIHKSLNRQLNGVHFELTGDPVTECTGGSSNLSEADLTKNYQTFCDPRLNYDQSMDMALLIAEYYQKERSAVRHL